MSKMPIIFVFSDKKDRLPEIIAGARALGEDVCAFVVGTDEDAQYAASLGAGVVYTFAPQQGVMLEDYAPSFAAVVATCGKKAMPRLVRKNNYKKMGVPLWNSRC